MYRTDLNNFKHAAISGIVTGGTGTTKCARCSDSKGASEKEYQGSCVELFNQPRLISRQYFLSESPQLKKENEKPSINFAFQIWTGNKPNLQFRRWKLFSSAIIQFTFGLFENSRVITLLAHTSERLGLLHPLRRSLILFLLLLFLFLLDLHCKRRPPPPDRTFHLRAAQSSALTNFESIFVSKSSFPAAPAQVLF